MATYDDVAPVLLGAVRQLAESAQRETDSSRAERFASAAKEVAEAYAWITSSSQPH